MQQSPLVETQSLSLAHRPDSNLDALDRTSRKNGPSFQGLRLPNTQTDSNQYQQSHSRQATQDVCSAQDSHSTSTSHLCGKEIDMDTSPTTPSGRGIAAASVRPPDAPRKSKQSRPPIQLSSNAPVRKLDFDSLRIQAVSNSEQRCDSRHSSPARG
ncbi:TPA: hypothetical protein ACH3X1_005518 [Trebouxia sp. C0004]